MNGGDSVIDWAAIEAYMPHRLAVADTNDSAHAPPASDNTSPTGDDTSTASGDTSTANGTGETTTATDETTTATDETATATDETATGTDETATTTDETATATDQIRTDPDGNASTGPIGATRRAAVLVPVVRDESILFTRRADHLGEHPGQMSFPGGGVEPVDENLQATARREAHEEIGLPRDDATIRGELDDIETVSEYVVTPFVATIPDRQYAPADGEVAEVVTLPVTELTDPANYEAERRDHPQYGRIRLDFFHVDDYTVWGATGRMLVQFLELATDWRVPPEHRLDPPTSE